MLEIKGTAMSKKFVGGWVGVMVVLVRYAHLISSNLKRFTSLSRIRSESEPTRLSGWMEFLCTKSEHG